MYFRLLLELDWSNIGNTFGRSTNEELKITAPDNEILLVHTLAKTSSSTCQRQFLYQQDIDQDGGGQGASFGSDLQLHEAIK